MAKLPKEILIYVCDYVDGEPLYGVVLRAEDIPYEADGDSVGVYTLNRACAFRVRRELNDAPVKRKAK